MSGEMRRLPIRHGSALYSDILSRGMYDVVSAVWELVKNGWDAGSRLKARSGADYNILVDILLVENHPLSPGSTALVVLDNGEGLTDPSLERFLTVGPNDKSKKKFGIMDQKQVGRLAAFALLKDISRGFWVVSSTSSVSGNARFINVNPDHLSKSELWERMIERNDHSLVNVPAAGSFTMIILPDVVQEARDLQKLGDGLKWLIPRCPMEMGFTLRINGVEVEAPELADELVLCDDENKIAGYFEKETGRRPTGIRICDIRTKTVVAYAMKMSHDLPYPFPRPEITGDVFIPGLVEKQNSDRTGLSPDFLRSEEWKAVCRELREKFVPELEKLIGEEGAFRQDFLGRAVSSVLKLFNEIWGKPKPGPEVGPPGITPPDDKKKKLREEPLDGDGGADKKPRPPSKPRAKAFSYKGKTYYVAYSVQPEDQTGEFTAPDVIYLNSRDPVTKGLEQAPLALQLHIARAIFGAIERSDQNLAFDSTEYERALEQSVIEFINKR